MRKTYNRETDVRIHNVQIGLIDFISDITGRDRYDVNKEVVTMSLPDLKKKRQKIVDSHEREFIDFYNDRYAGCPRGEDILFKKIVRY